MKHRLFMSTLVSLLVCCASGAFAEDLTDVDVDAEIRVRYESYRNFDFAEESGDNDNFVGERARLGITAEPKEGLSGRIEILAGYVWGEKLNTSESTVISPGEDETVNSSPGIDLHEAFFEVDELGGLPLMIRFGRQEMKLGPERLIGSNDWSDTPRSFDSLKLIFDFSPVLIDLAFAKLPENKSLYFAAVKYDSSESLGLVGDLHIIHRREPNEEGNGAAESLIDVGVWFDWKFFNKSLQFAAEADYQFGTIFESLPEEQKINAFAYWVMLEYQPDFGFLSPVVGAEYAYATGDEDTDMYKTFNTLYPSTGSYYGQMGVVGLSNMQSIRFRLGGDLMGLFKIYADYYMFRLAAVEDYWYIDGGSTYNDAYLSGENILTPEMAAGADASTDLGSEIDLIVEINANDYFDLCGTWGRFMPGSYITDTLKYGQELTASDVDYFYLQGRLHF
jgi:Alginate export